MLALDCGLTLATYIRPPLSKFSTLVPLFAVPRSRKAGAESNSERTSACDCRDTRTASADVTHPEHARQSVREISAGGAVVD
jgi:hypothetical protein